MKLTIDCSLFSVLTSVAAVFVLFCCELPFTSAKFCTKSQFQVRRNTSIIQVPCVQKFHERCPFSIFNYCTHYRTALCEKQLNFTYNWYHAVQVCCPGYEKSSSNTCIEIASVAASHTGPNWSRLSSGAYAGVAAGGVLLLCIIGSFIFVLYRRRQKKSVDAPVEVELEQRVTLQKPTDSEAEA